MVLITQDQGREMGIRIVALGDAGVGKKSLLTRYTQNRLEERYLSAVHYNADLYVDGKLYSMDALAISDYIMPELRRRVYRLTDVFLICFSPDSPNSYESIVHRWLPEISEYCPGVPAIIVCCKSDLRSSPTSFLNDESPYVDEDIASELVGLQSNGIQIKDYLECSAHVNNGIGHVLETACRVLKNK
mmetsp:Transcript_17489/g.21177  ORF Transcript_17489/g.21177 Transcript_17489/m.21177 type:complete len:188 (-) Transcript_17489:118-681(-)